MEDLRGELESRREAHAEALTSQRQRLVEEHQEELQSILKSREVELQKKLDDQAEVAKREASSRREAEEVRMFRFPSMVAGFIHGLESQMRILNNNHIRKFSQIDLYQILSNYRLLEKVFQP